MKKLLLLLIIPFLSFGQTPITDDNIHQAVDDWLEDPIQAELTYGHISDWDVSSVTNMQALFSNMSTFPAPSSTVTFNQDIGDWDVSSVTDMSFMFYYVLGFNQDIGDWDVSNVTDMSSMFRLAVDFNQDIGGWDVSNVTDMSEMFRSASNFNGDIGDWDVSNVTDMSSMLSANYDFNQDIGDWDVSNVTDMSSMFYSTTSFNQDIGDWDVSNVSEMYQMFLGCNAFDQDIGGWDVSNVSEMSGIFTDTNLSTANYDALLNCWSTLELQPNINFNIASTYCQGAYARTYIMYVFNWIINDYGEFNDGGSGFCNNNDNSEDCNTTFIPELYNNKSIIKTIDILGRENNNNKGFQLHIYDDGTVEKKYIIK